MNARLSVIYMSLFILLSCSQTNHLMVKRDKDGSKMLVGVSSKNVLMNNRAFKWFKEGYENYKPDSAAVRTISTHAALVHIEVFGGTWCGDTHELLPQFYKVMDAAGITDAQVTLHLVNRDKKTKDGSSDKYQITNVPTFIVLRDGKQIGKVVESVKTSIEADIAAILRDNN